MDIQFTSGGAPGTIRNGGVIETIPGETIVLPWPVTLVGSSDDVVIDGRSVACSAPGRFHLRSADGGSNVHLCSISAACAALIPDGDRIGHGRCDRRGIMRSLANHCPSFLGTPETLPARLVDFGG